MKQKLDSKKKKRTEQQKRWLLRQINDPYVAKAKKEGYRSRAAYKLIEINDKFKLFKPGQNILDLGAAPGSWLQVVKQKVGKKGAITGVDLLPIEPIDDVNLIQDDFRSWCKTIIQKFDGVISDMAPSSTGLMHVDQLKMAGLIEDLLPYLSDLLVPEGFFIFKTFQGGLNNEIQKNLKQMFKTVKHFKPKASRSDSRETYVICLSFTVSQLTQHQNITLN